MKKDSQKLQFPEGFLWGAATSAHQVEGNCHNDWSEWEKSNAERLAREAKERWAIEKACRPAGRFPEMFQKENYISGLACDHYNRYESDFDIAKELGHNAHRFSIEWSRIEPEEGKFDEKEIEHYRKVIKALRNRGMEPFVTLWHWTNPVWFGNLGGWENKKSIDYFTRFVEKIVSALNDDVRYWIVVNEPNVQMGFGYLTGAQPPGKKNIVAFLKSYFHLLSAYKKSYKIIHKINKDANVGIAHSYMIYDVNIWRPINKIAVSIISYFSNYFVNKAGKSIDFIGCNYYTVLSFPLNKKNIIDNNRSDLDWQIYPEGIYAVLKKIQKYNLPIYITENGIADANDSRRGEFIKKHLFWVYIAIQEGVDVRGYIHWSLLDNFEFPEVRGFWPRFGLVETDYKTMERKIRPSAWEYAKICRNNGMEIL